MKRPSRYVFLNLIVFVLLSCNGHVNIHLYGNWAVMEVFHHDEDISGRDGGISFSTSNSMTIDRSKEIIFLPIRSEITEYGYFKHYKENGKEWLRIFDATDERFNGVYQIHLEEKESLNNGNNKRYSLELESTNTYIYGEKMEVSF